MHWLCSYQLSQKSRTISLSPMSHISHSCLQSPQSQTSLEHLQMTDISLLRAALVLYLCCSSALRWSGYHDVDYCEKLCKEPLHWVETELWHFNKNWTILSSHWDRFVLIADYTDCWIIPTNICSDSGCDWMVENINFHTVPTHKTDYLIKQNSGN